ncbi:MAG: hypothetical protein A6F70_07690 [Cycloclasticus sp. symbiont of Bathymodiolus heckerae]|nr:MAG: hypothetical protein A6F70_07690 [Cycloclasticus sp. symbiont of Bathymodiolus heckerae]
MRRKNKIIFGALGAILLIIILFGGKVEDGLGCLAYYEQCTAKRVGGLTKKQCFNRDDVVAFLYEGNICLVKPSN